jgi:hypothetical protein
MSQRCPKSQSGCLSEASPSRNLREVHPPRLVREQSGMSIEVRDRDCEQTCPLSESLDTHTHTHTLSLSLHCQCAVVRLLVPHVPTSPQTQTTQRSTVCACRCCVDAGTGRHMGREGLPWCQRHCYARGLQVGRGVSQELGGPLSEKLDLRKSFVIAAVCSRWLRARARERDRERERRCAPRRAFRVPLVRMYFGGRATITTNTAGTTVRAAVLFRRISALSASQLTPMAKSVRFPRHHVPLHPCLAVGRLGAVDMPFRALVIVGAVALPSD